MANRFNFSEIKNRMVSVERDFLTKAIDLAKEEIKENFESQSSLESGKSWPELSYREEPPPRLQLTGELMQESLNNKPTIIGNQAILSIDPIDKRGKGYASYHEDGENQYKEKEEFQSEFVTQSKELENKQVELLIRELNKVFK